MSKTPYESAYPAPDHFLIHISDTHLTSIDEGLYGSTAHPETYLRELFRKLDDSELKPEAIIFSGDVVDKGEKESYRIVREIVEPVAKRMGTQIVWVMGNHDHRGNFRESLLDEVSSLDTIDKVIWLGGLRLIVLDSTVHEHHHGEVTVDQLSWLEEILNVPAPEGSILIMHHPPVPSVTYAAISVELRDQRPLAEVIRGSDIRLIIGGHLHYSTNGMFAGIPVSVASATCYTQDLNIPLGSERSRDGGQSFNLVHVYDETIINSVVPLGEDKLMKFKPHDTVIKNLKTSGLSGYPLPNSL